MSIVHQIPGRLRVRIPAGGDCDGIVDAVRALPGVSTASWSPRTRGLLVVYEPAAADPALILAAIGDHAGVDLPEPAPPAAGRPPITSAVTSLFGEADARLTRASGGMVGLGALVPLALTVWAGAEILRGRAAPLAWSTALWYAHGLFRDYSLAPRED